MGLTDGASISRFVKALDFPTNVMVRKGLPPVPELKRLGVARVSFGPSASYAAMGLLKRASREVREKGTFDSPSRENSRHGGAATPHPCEEGS